MLMVAALVAQLSRSSRRTHGPQINACVIHEIPKTKMGMKINTLSLIVLQYANNAIRDALPCMQSAMKSHPLPPRVRHHQKPSVSGSTLRVATYTTIFFARTYCDLHKRIMCETTSMLVSPSH